MIVPAALREGIERAVTGIPLADLQRAAQRLSVRYRAERVDGAAAIGDDLAARAYLATRLSATYAATREAFAAVARQLPGFAPDALADFGAGPGTVLWAAADCWPDLARAVLVERNSLMRAWGERLIAGHQAGVAVAWRAADIADDMTDLQAADLVTASYVLGEVAPDRRARLVERLWALTAGVAVFVEPGTPAGWERILAARSSLIAAGAQIVAPCPHARSCPLTPPDWCHFAARLSRSRMHRLAKGGEVPWEDEKFIYIAAARTPAQPFAGRVVARPRLGSGKVRLKVCDKGGGVTERLVTRRENAAFAVARRAGWGEALPASFPPPAGR